MIPPLPLDTITWADLMDAARSRLAELADSWTLHAPVDPGITLLEALATRLEDQLYRLDRTDPDLVRRMLRLLGTRPMTPARAAIGVVGAYDGPGVATLPAGTTFRSETASEAVVSTLHPVTVVPTARLVALEVAGVDQSTRLQQRELVALFPRPGAGRVRLVLWLPPYSHDRQLPFSVLLSLGQHDETAGPHLGWHEHTAGAPLPRRVVADDVAGYDEVAPLPPPFELTWSVASRLVTPMDGTFGLRGSGIVDLPLPRNHPGGELDVEITVDRSPHIETPLLGGVGLNAVAVQHRRRVTTTVDAGLPVERPAGSHPEPAAPAWLDSDRWNGLPGIELPLRPLIDGGRPATATTRVLDDGRAVLVLDEDDGRRHDWREVPSFGDCGPGDRCFVVSRADDVIRFGDGRRGRIPRPARPVTAQLSFDVGGGSDDVLLAASGWSSGDVVARTLTALSGGRETESAADAERRAGTAGRRRTVAVTAQDHADIVAGADPLLADVRVHVVPGYDPSAPVRVADAVAVVVVPAADRPAETEETSTSTYRVPTPLLDPGLRHRIGETLDASRLLGTHTHLVDPCYRPVTVTLEATGPIDRSTLDRVRGDLRRFLDPVAGGPRGRGWAAGQPVVPGQLLDRAQRAAGRTATLTRLVVTVGTGRPGSGPDLTGDCDPLPLGPIDLPFLHEVRAS